MYKKALMPSPLTPHWKDRCCHGIAHADCHRCLYLGKLLPKSLSDLVERRSHQTAGQLLTACLILVTPLQSW